VAACLLRALPGPFLTLSSDGYDRILAHVGSAGITGGAIFDALIGAMALEAGAHVLSRDARAASTYQAIGVDFELV
jgi:predicted nucleic acid-binding protein